MDICWKIIFQDTEEFEVTKLTVLKIVVHDIPIFIIWFSLQEKIEWGRRVKNVENLNKNLKKPIINAPNSIPVAAS